MRRNLLLVLLISIVPTSGACAAADEPLRLMIGTHLIQEVRSNDSPPRLLMDGKVLFEEAASYKVKLRRSIGEVPVAIVYADTGGASCNNGTSILISGESGTIRDVGKVDNSSCWTEPKYYVQSTDEGHEAIIVQQDPGVFYSGDLWSFSPREGLRKVADLTYAPQPGSSYQDLRTAIAHGKPIELFRNEAFSNDFDKVTGPAKPTILPAVGDAEPSSLIDGRYVIAEGYQPHNGQHQTLIAVDVVEGRVFVADHPDDGKIAVYPIVGLWPSPIRRKLAAWAKSVAPSIEKVGRR